MNSPRPAAAALVLTNALVSLGPLAFGWNLAALLMLYWLELVFVGLVNIAKMARASRLGELGKSRSYQAIFFITHYATFCVLYGVAPASAGNGQLVEIDPAKDDSGVDRGRTKREVDLGAGMQAHAGRTNHVLQRTLPYHAWSVSPRNPRRRCRLSPHPAEKFGGAC